MKRAVLIAAMAAGCSGGDGVGSTGTDVGNPITVDLQFSSYNRVVGEVAIDRAAVEVERIRLRPAADCEGGAEIELEGPFALDLVRPTALGELTGLDIDQQAYCRIELTWHRNEVTEVAILVGGAVAGDPLEVHSRRNDELRIEAIDGDGFTIDQATSALFVAFDMATWLAGLDLAGADREPDGAILVSDDSNRDLLDRFEDNVESAIALFADRDGDGGLDDDERADGDALAAGVP